MTILNDEQIVDLAINVDMIKPLVAEKRKGDKASYGIDGHSITLRLKDEYKVPVAKYRVVEVDGEVMVATKQAFEIHQAQECNGTRYIVIPPNNFVLAVALEVTNFPNDILGKGLIKSTYARKGLHANTTLFDAGFCGNLTIEISNTGQIPIQVAVGDNGVFSVTFHRGRTARNPYGSTHATYQNQQSSPQEAIV